MVERGTEEIPATGVWEPVQYGTVRTDYKIVGPTWLIMIIVRRLIDIWFGSQMRAIIKHQVNEIIPVLIRKREYNIFEQPQMSPDHLSYVIPMPHFWKDNILN